MKLALIFGTRPEAIKMAPVILEARARPEAAPLVISTGQHREMLRPILALFGIEPNIDLDLMQPGQTLGGLASRAMEALTGVLEREKPDAVVVQGDTTTAMCAALAAAFLAIPVAHVEAGLRSDRLDAPFPEEINRRLISQVAHWHFAPTTSARDNLRRDGIPHLGSKILVTGNTVIDALRQAAREVEADPPRSPLLEEARRWKENGGRLLLVTGHRRENFGEPFREFCRGLGRIAEHHPETLILYPVHLNPNVQKPVREYLGGRKNILLADPADYPVFVALMQAADLVVTDSGGVQEEAPALGKRVVVTREVTERPEAVAAGAVELVGPHQEALFQAAHRLLSDPESLPRRAVSPYGDGKAASRILDALLGGQPEEFAPEG